MKLLPKQEIQDLKNKERKTEIDEGAKLARKIDALRQTASQEESNLAKFREQSLGLLRKDIENLADKKESLMGEVNALEIKRKDLLNIIHNLNSI